MIGEEYKIIRRDLCQKYKPKKIGEIGVRDGVSASVFIQSEYTEEFWGFDTNDNPFEHLKQKFKELNSKVKVILKQCNTRELLFIGDDYDLVHIDGDHHFEYCLHDAFISWNAVKSGGMLLFHDYVHPPVKEAIDIFVKAYELNILKHYVIKEGDPQKSYLVIKK